MVEITGPDTSKMLQSVATNDFSMPRLASLMNPSDEHYEPSTAVLHTAFLSPKGRVLVGDALVFLPGCGVRCVLLGGRFG